MSNTPPIAKTAKTLSKNIGHLGNQLEKQVSFKREFMLSILRGAGYALGATLVASLVIAIMANLLRWTNLPNFLE